MDKFINVGTIGHVDHGSVSRAITNSLDTDLVFVPDMTIDESSDILHDQLVSIGYSLKRAAEVTGEDMPEVVVQIDDEFSTECILRALKSYQQSNENFHYEEVDGVFYVSFTSEVPDLPVLVVGGSPTHRSIVPADLMPDFDCCDVEWSTLDPVPVDHGNPFQHKHARKQMNRHQNQKMKIHQNKLRHRAAKLRRK